MPLEFLLAVSHADYVLQLQENLDNDEMPPSWMWPYQGRMNEWIRNVSTQRKSSSKGSDPEDENMSENVLLDELRKRREGVS